MCLAKAYHSPDAAEPILDNIALLRVEGDQVTITSLFGESKVVEGKISQIDFMKSRIIFETVPSAAGA